MSQEAPVDEFDYVVVGGGTAGAVVAARLNTGRTVVRGANWFQINCRPDGTRSSASVSYLHPLMGTRRNLEYAPGSRPSA